MIDRFTIELRNGDTDSFEFNRYKHRMASEFNDFVKIIDNHDTETADKLYDHSVTVMDVLAQAKKSVAK